MGGAGPTSGLWSMDWLAQFTGVVSVPRQPVSQGARWTTG